MTVGFYPKQQTAQFSGLPASLGVILGKAGYLPLLAFNPGIADDLQSAQEVFSMRPSASLLFF